MNEYIYFENVKENNKQKQSTDKQKVLMLEITVQTYFLQYKIGLKCTLPGLNARNLTCNVLFTF